MYLRNYLRQFLRDVRAQKLRLFLTVFGMVWGTAAVTLMLAFGAGPAQADHGQPEGPRRRHRHRLAVAHQSKPWQGLPRGRRIQLTDEDIELIRREVPEIDRISEEYAHRRRAHELGKKTAVGRRLGRQRRVRRDAQHDPAGGRAIPQPDATSTSAGASSSSATSSRRTCSARTPSAVGETVEIDGAPFTGRSA